ITQVAEPTQPGQAPGEVFILSETVGRQHLIEAHAARLDEPSRHERSLHELDVLPDRFRLETSWVAGSIERARLATEVVEAPKDRNLPTNHVTEGLHNASCDANNPRIGVGEFEFLEPVRGDLSVIVQEEHHVAACSGDSNVALSARPRGRG